MHMKFKMKTPLLEDRELREHIRNHPNSWFRDLDKEQIDQIKLKQRNVVQIIKKIVDENHEELIQESKKYYSEKIVSELKEE